MQQKLAAGNWKMNGATDMLAEISALSAPQTGPQVLICPPAPFIAGAKDVAQAASIHVGGQDCHVAESGAHTGDVAAAMLKDAGASFVIVGHSERRTDHRETDALVRSKAEAAHAAGLVAIICIGETEEERLGPNCLQLIAQQLDSSTPDAASADNTVIAYEPIWAIGTGRVPSIEQITETHDMIRDNLVRRFGTSGSEMRVLYGGSVKAGNAADIFAVKNVDGALVGGASLKAVDFQPIIDALAAS